MEPTRDKNEFRFVCAALLCGTFAAYAFVLRAGFINYDDIDYVTNNHYVKSGLTPHGVAWAFTTGYASNWHPLAWISLMLDSQLYGLRAAGFHLTNLLFHAANSVLLLATLRKMTGALWPSAFVAALFAWHPLHVESVAWIAERKDVLSAFFWLLTMLFYCRYVEALREKSPRTKKLYFLTLLFFICGLMSKPMVVTLPFVLLLMDYWPLKRVYESKSATYEAKDGGPENQSAHSKAGAISFGRILLEKIPFFSLALVSCVVTFVAQRVGGAVAPLEIVPLTQRIQNVPVSYVQYLIKMLWPSDLAVFYPLEPHWPVWKWAGAALLLVTISAAAIALAKKRPYLAVGWFWYVGTLVPVIGLVQVGEQALADRYTYLPLIGIFIALAWGVDDLTRTWPARCAFLKLAATAVLVACICLTTVQAGYWKDPITLFRHDLAVAKDNSVAHANIGEALDKQGKTEEAKAEFMKAMNLPGSPRALNGLGELYAREGDTAKAVSYFNAAFRKRPLYSDAHYNFGNLLAIQGKYFEAAEHYALALREKPNSADAYNNLGAMCIRLGKTNEAMADFKAALRIDPDFPEAHSQLGGVLLSLGYADAARAEYAQAVRLKPGSVASRLRLGLLLGQKGELDEAIFQFLDVTKREPTNIAAYYNLAAAYAAQNKLDAAAENFAIAARLDPKDADVRGRLAATLAVQGKTEEAVKVYREALRLKPDWPLPLRDLAWLLATNPKPAVRNGEEAVKLAEHANALLPKPNPIFLEALDAAYAEAGRFDDAIKTAEKVRQLATTAQQKQVADRAAQRIALYKTGKPFHEAVP
jgi:tetratricopeptide (TPR) repeat protein